MGWVPARSQAPEVLDRPDNAARDLRRAFGDIRKVNRFLGGRRALRRGLRPMLDGATKERPLRVLDIGTGDGDLARDVAAYGRRRGRRLRVTAVDRDPIIAALAGEHVATHPEVEVVCADAFALPFPPRSHDLVVASLFLHHFTHAEIVRLLPRLARHARRAVIVNDLRRDWIPWAFIRFVSWVTMRHPMFRHDAPLSVLRGFTPGELLEAAREAGLPATLHRCWPYRLILIVPAGQAR